MSDHRAHRFVRLDRVEHARFRATNRRGGVLMLGEGDTEEFTPVELLLVAIAGCSAIDVDYMTARRAEPQRFEVTSEADKLTDETGNHLGEVTVTFGVEFPAGEDGDRARAMLERAISRSHDRLCTVSRTVERPTPVRMQSGTVSEHRAQSERTPQPPSGVVG